MSFRGAILGHDRSVEAVVVGSGPAGLALAYELSMRDVDVLCVTPAVAPWVPIYGSFLDDVAGLDVPFDRTWDRALVSLPGRSDRFLSRPYGRLDRAALFSRWTTRLQSLSQLHPSPVSSALFSSNSAEILLADGSRISALQIFDASGHSPKLVKKDPTGYGYQCAFGRVIADFESPLSEDTMGLMLWDNGQEKLQQDLGVPLFDYIMHDSTENLFVERTALASRSLLKLSKLDPAPGARPVSDSGEGAEVERCIIPLGQKIPRLDQLVVGFGGAASMVHPATGYMVARVLRTAGPLADAFVDLRDQSMEDRARNLWRVVWPNEWVRTHAIYRFGLEVLLRLTPEETYDFFDAFFDLPEHQWRPYQSGTATVREVVIAMRGVFARVPLPLKRKLIAASFSPRGRDLGRLFY